ncbi:glycoside hydrolase family 30 protein [Salisediminibacterium halotolerans]|uniref:glycoside hydrolase family 30 protein n=1 Tax=Salisediminibacterium halotolerans TaxID=517425 RepID=UPI000F2D6D01|nr:glycoside hydrolase family 30 protein [Salisediminibacterium halotolerans]RLJ75665.1 glucosylceramidase [Actinophytocola xinjiangensis]RPE89519.1 glucosylceramidase [Salisediminibacterium halotolerans]TWG36278.1 glucosylceramidase [Salisediminibacterium halotolerans]GEL07374.1 glycosyl hydrolase [Salisediminibacterium halotolerans]
MKEVQIIQTSKLENEKWQTKDPLVLENEAAVSNVKPSVTIDPATEYQKWMGFGGAFTEAAAYTLAQVSDANRAEAIHAYFDKTGGLAYNLGRTHIHSCDFALENYTYVDEHDESLASFSIEREHKYVIPFIQDAVKKAGHDLTMLSSPWSPPAWMKTNGEMNNGGQLKAEHRQTWANYFVKYIDEMENAGIPIWGVSVQNEPAAVQTWDSCIYSAEEERDFVKNYLGPTLHNQGLAEKNIVIWDHNRDLIVERATTVLEDPEAAQYVWGTGNHWYVSEEFENLSKVHEAFPDKHLLFTEGCIEEGVHLGEWHTGERYARNIIGDMNNWLEGFIDWNLVLNEHGGPNHVGNYCDAPIIADTKNDQLHYNSTYYYIGHFSKFIAPGAKRIDVASSADQVSIAAFKNLTDEVVVVILNETENDQDLVLNVAGEQGEMAVPKRSITTCVIN